MASINYLDSSDDVADLYYTRPRYVEERLERYREEYSGRDDKKSRRILGIVDNIYDGISERRTSASFRKLRNKGRMETINQYYEVDEFQHSSMIMQDIIMQLPELRQRYQKGRVEAWDGQYRERDDYANSIGRSNRTYQMIRQEATEASRGTAMSYTYALTEEEGKAFSKLERGDISIVWGVLGEILSKDGIDPTSMYDTLL